MRSYETLSQALTDLKVRGFSLDFNLHSNCIHCDTTGPLSPAQFVITEVYRFEGMSNPDDSSVVYAIEGKNGEKGVVVDAYGIYADSLSTDMIEKLRIQR